MRQLRRRLLLLAFALTPLTLCQSASAQCDYGYGGLGWGYDIGRLYGVLSRNVPHYAAFPPVYYSYPVARSYGYSPFAYLPNVRTPDVHMQAEPVAIANPYMQQNESAETAAPAVDKTAAKPASAPPQVVYNPYVRASVEIDAGPMLQAATREW